MQGNIVPAVLIEAAYSEQYILSANSHTICRAKCPVGKVTLETITAEEAERRGINLFQVLDVGVARKITLGEELADLRHILFSGHKRLLDMDEFLWSEDGKRTIWKNPWISQVITQWKNEGKTIRTVAEALIDQRLKNNRIETREDHNTCERQYHPHIPVPPQPIQQGVYADWDHYCLREGGRKGANIICNFVPIPIRREYEFSRMGKRTICYVVRVIFWGFSKDLRIPESELGKMYPLISREIDSAVQYHPRVNQKIEVFVRSQFSSMREPDLTKLVDAGWQWVDNKLIYGVDNRVDKYASFFATGRNIRYEQMNNWETWGVFTKVWDVADDHSITSAMMLFHFLGLSYTLFHEAEFPLTFALFVVGTTGSLKTSLAKVIFDVFSEGGEQRKRTRTFSDTITSLEKYVGGLRDEVGLVDDLELGESDVEARRQIESFNFLIRLIGDAKGKNRSNPALQDIKAKAAYGVLAITGEQTIGKQSTRLRLVEVEVTRGAIRGERLSPFQDRPTLWNTVCVYYLDYCEKHCLEIIDLLKRRSRILRSEFQKRFKNLRTVDQLIAFTLEAELLERFWCNIGIEETVVHHMIQKMIKDVESLLLMAAESEEETNPGVRFLLDLEAMLGAKEINIEVSYDNFKNAQGCIGFFRDGYIMLLRDASFEAVLQYEKRMHRRYPFNMPKILKSLSELQAIEKQKNGVSTTYVVKKGGQNFIQIKQDRFDEIVAERG